MMSFGGGGGGAQLRLATELRDKTERPLVSDGQPIYIQSLRASQFCGGSFAQVTRGPTTLYERLFGEQTNDDVLNTVPPPTF